MGRIPRRPQPLLWPRLGTLRYHLGPGGELRLVSAEAGPSERCARPVIQAKCPAFRLNETTALFSPFRRLLA